jgi:hypothetical protein
LEDHRLLGVLDLIQFGGNRGKFILFQAMEEVNFLEERDPCREFDGHELPLS